jgi:hypothetical protein
MLIAPLFNISDIVSRQEAVSFLMKNLDLHVEVRKILGEIKAKKYTRNEWERCETTLEPSGKD